MSPINLSVELRPSTELLLAFAELTRSFDRLADAISSSQKPKCCLTDVPPMFRLNINKQPPAAVEDPEAAALPTGGAVAVTEVSAPKGPGVVWSEERKDVLRQEYPAGTPVTLIYEMICALTGPKPSFKSIAVMAYKLGLKRPNRAAPQTMAVSDPTHTVANFLQVARWAAERGLQVHDRGDIPEVNAKRVALGMPPFSVPEVR